MFIVFKQKAELQKSPQQKARKIKSTRATTRSNTLNSFVQGSRPISRFSIQGVLKRR